MTYQIIILKYSEMLYYIMSNEVLVPREHHMSRIRESRGSDFIKVLTGIRRCGKSTLMRMFIDELGQSGVTEDRILFMNLDDEGSGIETFRDLIRNSVYG